MVERIIIRSNQMADIIEKKVIDNYKEHDIHKITPDKNCSACASCWAKWYNHKSNKETFIEHEEYLSELDED